MLPTVILNSSYWGQYNSIYHFCSTCDVFYFRKQWFNIGYFLIIPAVMHTICILVYCKIEVHNYAT